MIRWKPGAVNRRTFVKEAALAAAAGSGLTGGLGGLSRLLAQPYSSGLSPLVVQGAGQDRPFNMICLGDSIMWGQGLTESTKFTYLIKTWLESLLPGRSVNRLVYARSGATLAPDKDVPDESHVQAWMNDRTLGEVPCSWPWVRQQVVVARADLAGRRMAADDVDLVLLDGGINDIRIGKLLNVDTSPETIQALSVAYCRSVMFTVLAQVRNNFPRAKILVTGYFPIASEQSNLDALAVLLSFLLLWQGPSVNDAIKRKLTTLSDTWYQASNSDLAGAVAQLNGRADASSPSSSTPPAAFAMIPWEASHSYAAPDSRLYIAGLPNDPVYEQRRRGCDAAGPAKRGDPLCLDAKIGHPNPSGAEAYADACQTQLRQYLPEWGARMISACVDMDPMPTSGMPTTLTVRATTVGPTGPTPLPATVRVRGLTFPTGSPVSVSLCTGSVCEPITVSAPGYVDVVIRDYLKAQPLP